ncbi:MAG: ABC transporter ATP-binding protein [Verrucomicrobiota bacterium]|jgi:ABC-type multidrug transport system fused ATPase/permease subunit|nr:ABC transporter ATP-binding protein [Verrucomicrobiota bacterium]MDP7291873.1 ABC transporter ATP-binding protein [Verrucomicrobiota bacterium]MDP7442016.1 ABC transporter ATP-binding protein [Verrucomicrobiota bacterium]
MSHGHRHLTENDPTFTAKKRSTTEIIRRVSVYLWPYKWLALATIGCAVLSLLCAFAFPRLTQYIIDVVIDDGQTDKLTPVILLLLGAFFLRDFFNSIRIQVNNHFEQNVVFDMRRDVYGRLQRLPVSYYDKRASGDLMTRVIEDVNAVERLLIDGTEQGTVAIVSIFGVLAILFATNPLLAGVAMIPIPLLAIGAMCYTLTAHSRYRKQRQASSAMNALLMDNLQGIREIKAFDRERHEDERFTDRAEAMRQGTLTIMRAWAFYNPAMSFIAASGTGLVLWFGGNEVMNSQMSVGELVAFLFYLALFYEPVSKLHGLNQMLQAARAGGERVFDILDTTEERKDAESSQPLPKPVRGEVEFREVHFEYTEDKPALHDISLIAKPGQMTALVGPTGAGKSTLVNLLPAFYEATSGAITIDGQDIPSTSLESLRKNISVVSQEPFLFNGTVGENIAYGNLAAGAEQISDAARAANCFGFISELADGFDTQVGERGVRLSVGEKQRISIARALLKDAPILILDEATASVDTATERLIQQALERLMTGRTTFVIAHRLSTIRNADQILVLKNGRIIERGSHEELLKQQGLYARLARIQNTTFIEESFAKLEPVT